MIEKAASPLESTGQQDGEGRVHTTSSPCLSNIRLVRARARPAANHDHYEEWQPANIYVVLRADDEMLAERGAIAELERQRWELLEVVGGATLVEARVRSEGGDVWEDYLRAAAGEIVVRSFSEHFVPENAKGQRFLPSEIDEKFFDEVMRTAGGRRVSELLSTNEPNADYLLMETVYELKTLNEDRLQKDEAQARLAQLFLPYYPDSRYATIDADVLSPSDRRIYADILSTRIKKNVGKASNQVRSTKAALGDRAKRGGLIMMNVGFPALNHELFAQQVRRFAAKDSTQFHDVISICVWVETNGFDSCVLCAFEPRTGGSTEVDAIRAAFHEQFERLMTDLVQGKQCPNAATMTPGRPVAFSHGSLRLRWEPASVPLSIKR